MGGLEGDAAASGDPSPVTAEGIFRGIRLCVSRALDRDLAVVTVAIQSRMASLMASRKVRLPVRTLTTSEPSAFILKTLSFWRRTSSSPMYT